MSTFFINYHIDFVLIDGTLEMIQVPPKVVMIGTLFEAELIKLETPLTCIGYMKNPFRPNM